MNELANPSAGPVRPVALSIEVGSGMVEVRTDATRPAVVRAEPLTPNDPVALDLINRARKIDTGDRLDVRFPDPPPTPGGNVISGMNISGGVIMMGGDVVINGQRVGGGSLNVTAIVPPGSSVTRRRSPATSRLATRCPCRPTRLPATSSCPTCAAARTSARSPATSTDTA